VLKSDTSKEWTKFSLNGKTKIPLPKDDSTIFGILLNCP
jgi:hypothetical protein